MATKKTKSVRTVKKLAGGKRNKWKKGESGSSNPDSFRHRDDLTSRFGRTGAGPPRRGLGASLADQLKKLDDDGDDEMRDDADDAVSVASSGATFRTWATGFTACTNTSFNKVLLFSNGDSAAQKEILALLAAVTEVIKTRGGKESETEYFAVLMTTMAALPDTRVETLAAASYLLSLVLRRVGEPVLRKKFSECAGILTAKLAAVAADPPTSLTKSLLRCLARMLRVLESAVWREPYSLQVFQSLLTFVTNEKPKIRAAAQVAVCSILRGSAVMLRPDPPATHPAASAVADHLVRRIEESGGERTSFATLYSLELLKETLSLFPAPSLKSVSETLLRVMTLGNALVVTKALDVLHSTFEKKPKAMTPQLNAQILTALYDFQPHLKDAQPFSAWLMVMKRAHTNLFLLDPNLGLSHLPKFVVVCLTSLLSDDEALVGSSKSVLVFLLEECLAKIPEEEKNRVKKSSKDPSTPLHRIFVSLQNCLNFQYHSVWEHSLEILGKAFRSLGEYFKEDRGPLFKSLQALAELRETPTFSHKAALDSAVGQAVRSVGPEFVLGALPLQISGSESDALDFPRSWLLPVLRDWIEGTELAFFVKYFLPLSSKLYNRAVAKAKEEKMAEAKVYEVLQYQIWCLLPGFCSGATDVVATFKSLARTLGVLLRERDDVRNEIMAALRNLILKAKDDESKLEVKRFAKNYLPILFNLYTSEEDIGSSPLAVLETIRVVVGVADADIVHGFVGNLFPKLGEDGISSGRRLKLLDIAVAMTPRMNEKSLVETYDLVVKFLKSPDKGTQKKCYRILEEMCKRDSPFVVSKMDELCKTLVSSLSLAGAAAKSPRLRSLTQLVAALSEPRPEFLRRLIPEAVVCCGGGASGKTTRDALVFLSKSIERLAEWLANEKTKSEVVGEVIETLCAGLAGDVTSVAATTVAVTHVLKEHSASVDPAARDKLFQICLVLLRSGKKPILKHVLPLAKLLLKKSHIRDFGNNARELTTALGEFSEMDKKAFRKSIRIVLSIALKTLGVEVLIKMVPDCFKKVVSNIHKTKTKKEAKKKKEEEEEEEEDEEEGTLKIRGDSFDDMLGDDSDVEEDDESRRQRPKLKAKRLVKKREAWLEEKGDEEEIVDLLDPSAAGKVLTSKPAAGDAAGKRSGVKHDFKVAPDGRFIFTDPKEPPPAEEKKEVTLEMNELMEALEGPAGIGKKRKVKWRDEDDEEDEEDQRPAKYVAGGKGIHRPIGKEAPSKDPGLGTEYRSKKAKGDMKKKGKPDPYAYFPLDSKSLNRRKVKKLRGQFKGVVGAARKGALKGKKLKMKQKRK